ncbi:MAG: secretion system protein [Dehalococcoidia bacterium]|nr:secretion system protein [Dehalococcoidia bacterium]
MIFSLLTALLIFGGVLLIFLGLLKTLEPETGVEDRLDSVLGRRPETAQIAAKGGERGQSNIATSLSKAFAKRTYGQKVSDSMARADLKLTVGEFMMIKLGTTVMGAAAGFLAGITNALIVGMPILFVIVFAFVGYKAPNFYVGRREAGRLNKFNDQLPDSVTLMANALRSGNSVLQAMELVSREAQPPTNDEFRRVVTETSLGIPAEDALNNLVRRMPSGDLDLLVTSMAVQREVGGNLAQLLESIGGTIRERVKMKGEIKTKTSQVMGSAYIMTGLPVIIGFVLFLLNGDFMRPMFSGCFIVMPICAAMLLFGGFMAMKSIVAIEV